MRLSVLTEAMTLSESSFDMKAIFTVKSSKHSLKSEFNPDISREFIKNLNVDKVVEAVSATRPYVSTFFTAVLNRDYDSVIDVLYPIASMLNGPYSNNSGVVDEFKPILSLGDTYFDAVNKFLAFYVDIEGGSSIVLKKVKAIYDRFKDNRASILDSVFKLYESYLETLKDGKETAKSRKAKDKIYSEYVKKQSIIESVIDEVASISNKVTEDSPLKNINGGNYDVVNKFFEENRSEMKKISAKLLFLVYLDGILKDEQGSLYSAKNHSKFAPKKDKNSIISELKSQISDATSSDFQVSLTNEGFNLTVSTISSVDFQKLADFVASLAESGSVSMSFLEMNKEIQNLPEYSFYYAYDEVFGTKNLILYAAKLLDIESVKNAVSILVNQPMPEDFDLGAYSFSTEGNSIKSNQIALSDLERAYKYVKVFAILKNFSVEEYETEVTSIVKRLFKNPEATFPLEDVLKSLRKKKSEAFNLLTYSVLKSGLRNPETHDDVSDIIAYVAYDAAVNGREMNKLFIQMFKKVLVKAQDDVVAGMIRKTKGNPELISKVKDFLSDYSSVLSADNLATIGVVENAE